MNRTRRPNILFIMDDQHRADYLSCAGASWVRTPNLDALAARGTRFTHCCTNAPVCAPARIALAAGLQPHRVGALNNHAFLPLSVPTYYQRLRNAGYYVGMVGKLDLAKPDPYNGIRGDRPVAYAWGFTHPEECEGKMHAGKKPGVKGPYTRMLQDRGLLDAFVADYHRRENSPEGFALSDHDSVLPADAFEDAYIGRRAAEWIADIPDDFPFHMFVSFVGPHDPYDPPTEYADRYRNAPMPPAIRPNFDGKPAWTRRRLQSDDPEKIAHTRRQYCAAIELIDDHVGRIMAALQARGMLDNTYIVYASDHGEMLGDHGFYTKSVPYEAALRVPLIVAGPGVAQGRVSDALVELIDVNPTICEMAGLPPQEGTDARSIMPVARGEASEHRSEIISGLREFRLVRDRRYKLIENVNDRPELYDLENDPDEQRNVFDERPDVARDMSRRLLDRFLEGAWQH